MKISTRLLFTVVLGMILAGCASQPAEVAAEEPVARNCLRDTGTRIKLPEGRCVNARGRVLTREDIEQVGGVGEALRRLPR